MIILPDQHQPRGKVLLPQRKREWQQSSQRAAIYGIASITRWEVKAKHPDGSLFWCGFFYDREEVDAFLHALILGTLVHQPPLWRSPVPEWHPDMFRIPLIYECTTVSFLTSPTGSNQTFNVPSDWNNANNNVSTIGAGGTARVAGAGSGGGGGGAFSRQTPVTLTPGGTTTYQIGASTNVATVNGGDTWFAGTTLAGSQVGAKGGNSTNGTSGASGGAAASGVGGTKNSGGAGGNGGTGGGSGGGGGAAGPNGTGGAGGLNSNGGGGGGGGNGGGTAGGTGTACCCTTTGTGGNGGNNSLGAGGGTGGVGTDGGNGSNGGGGGGGGGVTAPANEGDGGNGGNGVEWTTHGSGGGGGGNGLANSTGGSPGIYGGASGGGSNGSVKTSGQGVIRVEYDAIVAIDLTITSDEFVRGKAKMVGYA